MKIIFRTTPPDPEQYFALFETTGWNQVYQATPEDLARVVANSHFTVSVYAGERLVGFGRLLSDGVLHAMIYDMKNSWIAFLAAKRKLSSLINKS